MGAFFVVFVAGLVVILIRDSVSFRKSADTHVSQEKARTPTYLSAESDECPGFYSNINQKPDNEMQPQA